MFSSASDQTTPPDSPPPQRRAAQRRPLIRQWLASHPDTSFARGTNRLRTVATPLRVSPLSREEHRTFLLTAPGLVSFLQCPSWAEVKSAWEAEHLGWADPEGNIVGAALVLYRRLPRSSRSIAYLPEGPVIDWTDPDLARWLQPLRTHLRSRRAFAVKIGPPVVARSWQARTLGAAVTDGRPRRVDDVPPDTAPTCGDSVRSQLTALGWRRAELRITDRGDVQPRLVFEVPLAGRSVDELWAGLSQQWRRNVRKAQKSGVEVALGGRDDLPTFFRLLEETQSRDGFDLGRSLAYFERQHAALNAEEPNRMRLYLASYDDEVLAAHTMVVVNRRAWYLHGASASHRREVRPSHALQWQMIQDAHRLGCDTYDMRGFNDTLDRADPAYGLLQWKLGTGGQAVEYLGEWDLPLSRPLYTAARKYLDWQRR